MKKVIYKILDIISTIAIVIGLTIIWNVVMEDKIMATEIETYTAGYEINQMNLAGKGQYGFIAIRNDEDSAILRVTLDTFADYKEGEIVEVKVKVMESRVGDKMYNTYTLIEPER